MSAARPGSDSTGSGLSSESARPEAALALYPQFSRHRPGRVWPVRRDDLSPTAVIGVSSSELARPSRSRCSPVRIAESVGTARLGKVGSRFRPYGQERRSRRRILLTTNQIGSRTRTAYGHRPRAVGAPWMARPGCGGAAGSRASSRGEVIGSPPRSVLLGPGDPPATEARYRCRADPTGCRGRRTRSGPRDHLPHLAVGR